MKISEARKKTGKSEQCTEKIVNRTKNRQNSRENLQRCNRKCNTQPTPHTPHPTLHIQHPMALRSNNEKFSKKLHFYRIYASFFPKFCIFFGLFSISIEFWWFFHTFLTCLLFSRYFPVFIYFFLHFIVFCVIFYGKAMKTYQNEGNWEENASEKEKSEKCAEKIAKRPKQGKLTEMQQNAHSTPHTQHITHHTPWNHTRNQWIRVKMHENEKQTRKNSKKVRIVKHPKNRLTRGNTTKTFERLV